MGVDAIISVIFFGRIVLPREEPKALSDAVLKLPEREKDLLFFKYI
jgi:hypothetical protein